MNTIIRLVAVAILSSTLHAQTRVATLAPLPTAQPLRPGDALGLLLGARGEPHFVVDLLGHGYRLLTS